MFTRPSKLSIMSTQKRINNRNSKVEKEMPTSGLLQRTKDKQSDVDYNRLSYIDDMVLEVRKAFKQDV